MATFQVNKTVDDISTPVVAPEGWYKMRLVKEPKLYQKEGKRNSIILDLRIVDSPEYAGLGFSKFITLPNEADKETLTARGTTMEDFLLSKAYTVMVAFGHMADSAELCFDAGDEAYFYVNVVADPSNPDKTRNELAFDVDPCQTLPAFD